MRELQLSSDRPMRFRLFRTVPLSRVFKALVALCCLACTCGASEFAVEIDLQEQRAYLLRNGRSVLESPISSGRAKHRTPTGRFKIIEKDMDHRSSLYGKIVDSNGRTLVGDADADMPVPAGARFVNAPMHYFMRFTGGIGMHAGYLPGYPASHGCVRLPRERAVVFYHAVRIGTPVTVFGDTSRKLRAFQPERRYEPGWFEPFRRW
jgi:hypothetical protein